MATDNAGNPIPTNSTLNITALHHLAKAAEWANLADMYLTNGLNSDEERDYFGLDTHMAQVHTGIAVAATQITNSVAVEQFPEILSTHTTRLEAGAVAQEETTVTYRQAEVRDHAPAFQDQRDRAGIGPEDAVEVVRIHTTEHPDMEVRAEIWNEGFDTAHRQGVGGEHSREWLVGKLKPFLDDILRSSDTPYNDEVYDHWIDGLADDILDDSLVVEADSDPRPDQKRGMYGKYEVHRLHDPEGKHADDRFFVLDPLHDPVALDALKAYSNGCRAEYPKLSDDLADWIHVIEGEQEEGGH